MTRNFTVSSCAYSAYRSFLTAWIRTTTFPRSRSRTSARYRLYDLLESSGPGRGASETLLVQYATEIPSCLSRHCSPIFPPLKHSSPPRHLAFVRCSSSAPPLRPYRLFLQLEKSSAMKLDELVACFGNFGGLKLKTHKQSNATIMSNLPAEHAALYPKIVSKICQETCNFPIGKGRLWLFKTTGDIALMIPPPAEVYSIWGEMWKAMKGLPSAERLETPVNLMVPV